MMVGMTGAGKSLMINNLVNYIYGVDFKDKFRFSMILTEEEIDERGGESKCLAESMTSWVTAFDLNWKDGSRINFNLTVIDTPGFGDTGGIAADESIIDRIRTFYNDESACSVQEMCLVGFVIQASISKLTLEQKYVFDSVLNIFGKDMSDNVSVLFTFADAQAPPAMHAIKKAEIPFNCSFKFNNSAVYAAINNEDTTEADEFAWKSGFKNLEKFFDHLGSITPTSLTQTKAVLMERDKLKHILEGLKPRIDQGMNQLQVIENKCDGILRCKGTAQQNANHKVVKSVEFQSTKDAKNAITNCLACMYTCHDPCFILGDIKSGCSSMQNGKCVFCPGKCPWEVHKNGTKVYVYTMTEQEETIKDMLDRYNIAMEDKGAMKKLLKNLLGEYKGYKENVYCDIKSAAEATNRLDEIAMKNSFLTNVEYIERLIEGEKKGNRENKENRLEQLKNILGMAEILKDAKENPTSLTEHVSKYEQTVLKRIAEMDEDIDIHSLATSKITGETVQNEKHKQEKKSRKSRWFPW